MSGREDPDMPAWPHDDNKSKIAFFGKPGTNLVAITPPFQMFYAGHPIKTITVNKMIATALLSVFTEILDKCGHDQGKVDAIGASSFGGCYNNRPIRGSSNLSNHAFGAAIDLDPEHNPLGAKTGRMSPIVIAAFKRQGFLWGGDYKGRKDWMHFEAVSR
jgi:hypothetical protein